MHVLLDSSLLQMGLIFRVKSILEPKLETFYVFNKELACLDTGFNSNTPLKKISPRDKSAAYRH